MNSAKYINYDLRPAKFVERKMFVDVLNNIIGVNSYEYQYIGLGGLFFTDFKLFHKELSISKMISVEGGSKIDFKRIEFNNPFNFIDVIEGHTTDLLDDDEKINLEEKSIVWMDYDNYLQEFMFEDITHIFKKINCGSVYIFTCNSILKNSDGKTYSLDELKEEYGGYVPYELTQKDLTDNNIHNVIVEMIQRHVVETLTDRKSIAGDNLKAYPLFKIKYAERGGAPMLTYALVLEEEGIDIVDKYSLSNFDFVIQRGKTDFFEIELPNVSYIERKLIDKTNKNKTRPITKKSAVDPSEIERYRKLYKYLPSYFDVRH